MSSFVTGKETMMWKKWHYSLILGVVYVATFHFWMICPNRPWVIAGGIGV